MLHTPDHEKILESVFALIEARETSDQPLTQAHIAAAIDVSPATVSNFLRRKEIGDVDRIAGLLKAFVQRETSKETDRPGQVPFVKTAPAVKLLDLITYCHTWNKMGAGAGWSGVGKTSAIKHAMEQDPSIILITSWSGMGAIGLIRDLSELLRVDFDGASQYALMKAVKKKLADKRGESLGRCIIVDDAHLLTFKALDVLRYIHDMTKTGIVLVGLRALKTKLESRSQEMEQLTSRIASRLWEIPDFTLDDAELFFKAAMPADAKRAMGLLEKDPRSTSSGRWLGDLLEIAGKFASNRGGRMELEDVRKAVKVAA